VDIKELVEEQNQDQEEPDEEQEEVEEEQEQYQEFLPEHTTRTVINGHRSGKQLRLQDTGEIIYQGALCQLVVERSNIYLCNLYFSVEYRVIRTISSKSTCTCKLLRQENRAAAKTNI